MIVFKSEDTRIEAQFALLTLHLEVSWVYSNQPVNHFEVNNEPSRLANNQRLPPAEQTPA
jgi:hypothetical protein